MQLAREECQHTTAVSQRKALLHNNGCDLRLGEGGSQPLDRSIQDPKRALFGRRVAGARQVAKQELLGS
jgi:hypothetical protein